jgi:phage/plasmid-like protein (TIGR03299 family)
MSHAVESLFYTGEVPWHGLGEHVEDAPSSDEALRRAQIDWEVLSSDVIVDGKVLPHYKANVRESDGQVFGIVSDRYKIVQNREAFSFTDFLLKNDQGIPVTYETAGSLHEGRRVWLCAKLPVETVLGDSIVPYIVFVNTHDGKGSIKIAMTPTRVVCQNTLTLALGQAQRTWSTRHTGDLAAKMRAANDTLELASYYMSDLKETADLMQQKKLTSNMVNELVNKIFPLPEDASDRAFLNVKADRDSFMNILNSKDDLRMFKDSAWGVYNALADFESHIVPKRASLNFRENVFTTFIDGNARMKTAESLLLTM